VSQRPGRGENIRRVRGPRDLPHGPGHARGRRRGCIARHSGPPCAVARPKSLDPLASRSTAPARVSL